jgi:hypothetical protein
MHPETEIRRLDTELSGLEERYGRIMRESMDANGGIELRDESLRREASDLKQRIIEIKRRRDGLKYSLLSDDEKNRSRRDQIALATKFSDEGANAQRLSYMNHYLELLEKTAHLAGTDSEKGREYRALYDYLNGQDFRYSLEADFDSFCAGFIKYPHEPSPGFSDDELKELKDAGFVVHE